MRYIRHVGWLWGVLSLMAAMPAAGATINVNVESHNVVVGTIFTENVTVTNSQAASLSDIEGMAFTFQIADGTGTAPSWVPQSPPG